MGDAKCHNLQFVCCCDICSVYCVEIGITYRKKPSETEAIYIFTLTSEFPHIGITTSRIQDSSDTLPLHHGREERFDSGGQWVDFKTFICCCRIFSVYCIVPLPNSCRCARWKKDYGTLPWSTCLHRSLFQGT